MGKQNGIIQLKGTIGNITFYETQDGFLFKKKTRINRHTLDQSPHATRIKENWNEFSEASKSGKALRNSIHWLTVKCQDNRVMSRLNKVMHQVLKLDPTSARGARNVGTAIVQPMAIGLLKSFNFNIRAILGEIMHKPYTVNTGTGVITINGLIPINDITKPEGATHVSLQGAWARVDFTGKVFNTQATNVVNLPIDGTSTNVTLTPVAVPTGTGTNIFVLEVEFFQLVNGIQYALKNGSFNALSIVDIA